MRDGRPHRGGMPLLRAALIAFTAGCSDDVPPATADATTGPQDIPLLIEDGTTIPLDGTRLVCPNDLPAGCPAAPPHYAEAAAVIALRCFPCHAPGGQAADRPLTTYAQVYPRRVAVLTQVYGCHMPPETAPALAPAERALLLAWLVCHAPP